jgi:hypothetical protein
VRGFDGRSNKFLAMQRQFVHQSDAPGRVVVSADILNSKPRHDPGRSKSKRWALRTESSVEILVCLVM